MIVNLWSAGNLALDALSLGLAVTAAAGAAGLIRHVHGEGAERQSRLYLVCWQGVVLLGLRALAWPLFYLGLESFVPEIQGAMCVFGVRNVLPTLTRILELLKPLLALLGLVWLLVFRLEHFFPAPARAAGRVQAALLFVCALLAGADAGGSLGLWLGMNPELAVTCCSTVTDVPDRFTVWLPASLLGSRWSARLLWLALAVNGLVLGLLFAGVVRLRRQEEPAVLLLVLAVVSPVTAALDWLVLTEAIAPILMGLPFHHCLYCLGRKVVDAPLILGLLLASTLCALAAAPVWILSAGRAEPGTRMRTTGQLLHGAIFCRTGAWLMTGIHLLAGP